MGKRILLIFGTRPEAIKMFPLIKRFRECSDRFDLKVCVTAQHREMLDQALRFFGIKPDIDLDLMKPDQSLSELTADIILHLSDVLRDIKPSLLLVQGDTTTAFVGTLAAFYQQIPVGHVEAGLRTNNIYDPFPEEVNRRLISDIATLHFAPTENAARSLRAAGCNKQSIYVTGNTVVDALKIGLSIIRDNRELRAQLDTWFTRRIARAANIATGRSRLVLITCHRRESFGAGLESICYAIRELSIKYSGDVFVYPVHLNPNVQGPVFKILGHLPNVSLIEPLDYPRMIYLMTRSYLILTDSGGIQEEAPSLKIPVLVMRNVTERPEGVQLGGSILVGTNKETIVNQSSALLDDLQLYKSMQMTENPYGDGRASERIVGTIEERLL
jgi:UDP-N-acetylglucosamine 2-epimerase (non-hydrolysing)